MTPWRAAFSTKFQFFFISWDLPRPAPAAAMSSPQASTQTPLMHNLSIHGYEKRGFKDLDDGYYSYGDDTSIGFADTEMVEMLGSVGM